MLEGLWLVLGRKRPALDVLLALLPGALMVLALRAALTSDAWLPVAGWLAASLPAHLADLRRRRLL